MRVAIISIVLTYSLTLISASVCPQRKTTIKLICYYSKLQGIDKCKCTHLVLPDHTNLETIERLRVEVGDVKLILTVREFNQDVVEILNREQVDGVDVNLDLNSKNDINDFVSTLKNKFGKKQLFLSIPSKMEMLARFYELKELTKMVDYFVLQTAFMLTQENVTFHPSRLSGLWDMQNTDSLVDLVNGMGVPLTKLIISAPVQGFKFTLKNRKETTPGSEIIAINSITRDQLCDRLKENSTNWILERDQDQTGPYIFKDKEWIAFDDEISIDIKAKYTRIRGLAGLALKDLTQDSQTSECQRILDKAHEGLYKQARAPRAVVLQSLSREIADNQVKIPQSIQVSPFRITRIIDVEGNIHVVRQDSRTEFECSRQGYFVHPRSCSRFYRCVKFNQLSDDFNVFEFDCPTGLVFDNRYEVCVWPGSLPNASPCSGSSEIAPVPQSRFVCPQQPGYFADPENCRWFFACLDHGRSDISAYEFRCPFGLVFDEDRLLCEWPWLVPKCGSLIDVRYQPIVTNTPVSLKTYDGLGPLVVKPVPLPEPPPVTIQQEAHPISPGRVPQVPVLIGKDEEQGERIAVVGPSNLPEQPHIVQIPQQPQFQIPEQPQLQINGGPKLNNLIQEQFEDIVKQNLHNVAQQGRIFNSQNYNFGEKTIQYTGTGPLTGNNKFVAVNFIENANVRLEDSSGTRQSGDKNAQLITVTTTPIKDTGIVGAKITLSENDIRDGVDIQQNRIESITPIPIGAPRPVVPVFAAPAPILKPDIQTVSNGVVANVPELQFRIVPTGNIFLPNLQNGQQYFVSRGSSGFSNVSQAFVNYVSTTTSPLIAHSTRVPSILFTSTSKPIVTYDEDEYSVAADNVQSREAVYSSPPPLIHLSPIALSAQNLQPIEAVGVAPKSPDYYINYSGESQSSGEDKSTGSFSSNVNFHGNTRPNLSFQSVFLSPIPINYQNVSRRTYNSNVGTNTQYNLTQPTVTSNTPGTSVNYQSGFANVEYQRPVVPLNAFGTIIHRQPILVSTGQQNSYISEQYGEKNLRPVLQLYQQPTTTYGYQNLFLGEKSGRLGVPVQFQTYYYPKPGVKFEVPTKPNIVLNQQPSVTSTYYYYQKPTVRFQEPKVVPVVPKSEQEVKQTAPTFVQTSQSNEGSGVYYAGGTVSTTPVYPNEITVTSGSPTIPVVLEQKPAITSSFYYQKEDADKKVNFGTTSIPLLIQNERQPVTEVPFVSSKAYVTGSEQSNIQTRPLLGISQSQDNYPKPAERFSDQPFYYSKEKTAGVGIFGQAEQDMQPVTEIPFVTSKAYVTGDEQNNANTRFVSKDTGGYYYPKPAVGFSDQKPNYENEKTEGTFGIQTTHGQTEDRQPVTEVPFVTSKAYVTGSEQARPLLGISQSQDNYPKPAVVFSDQGVSTFGTQTTHGQTEYRQPVTEVPFVSSKVYVTGNEQNNANTRFGSEDTGGYYYPKPAVKFSEQKPNYENQKPEGVSTFGIQTTYGETEGRQPVTEVPFESKKAYVTGNEQTRPLLGSQSQDTGGYHYPKPAIGFPQTGTDYKSVTSFYPQSTPLPIYTNNGLYVTQRPAIQPNQATVGYYQPVVAFNNDGYKQPVYEESFVAKQAYTTGYPKPKVRFEDSQEITISTPGPFQSSTVTTSTPIVTTETRKEYYEDSTERKDNFQEVNENNPIIVESQSQEEYPDVTSVKPGKVIEDYNLERKTYVMANDFHSFLPAKLSGQCTCTSNPEALRRSSVKALPTSLLNDDQNRIKGTIVEKYEASRLIPVTSTTTKTVQPTYTSSYIYTTPLTVPKPSKEDINEVVENGLVKTTSEGWKRRELDCQRAGLFRHPDHCNKFYSCRWDCEKKRHIVHIFDCPVHLTFDNRMGACNWPSKGPACAGNTLLPNN